MGMERAMKPRQAKKRVYYVVIEGPDGSGKTETTLELATRMRECGVPTDAFKTPSVDGPIGRLVRAAFEGKITLPDAAMMHLIQADAIEQEHLIRERTVATKRSAVLDRHTWISGMVYQRDHHTLRSCLEVGQVQMFARPTLLVYLDIEPELALEWIRKRRETQPNKVTDRKYTPTTIEKMREVKARYEVALAVANTERWPRLFKRYRVSEDFGPKDVARAVTDLFELNVAGLVTSATDLEARAEETRRDMMAANAANKR